ncbi:dTDP-glucose 4,6-dehydratase [Streptomyces sp. ST2-7A]|uniref:dTDP-glucose 4,6-dehydratase n=1 Tax=Streptomyces sp. ST2-7A TaxID=2907214 RepID=UPI001F36371D|nr:dTDP-glucose 4,6-dehydratase [Streptomyces sp. ST2-7A]MCE7082468.1 dTDP-glucose 4,6-dehydratase [Streptomyces sp. ST2-7A]
MKVLVTGGAGFIGSHYVRSLLAGEFEGFERDKVTVLDKLSYAGNRENLPGSHPRLDFVEGDVCDLALLLELLPGHDALVHFAAESHVDRSLESAAEFIRTNVAGTQAVLEAALRTGTERVVHVSTDEVYGSVEKGSWTENSPLLPNSPYAASKAASDLLARSYWRSHALDVSITRCSNNYGPYQHPEKLIPRFVTNLLEGERVPLYGDGGNVREWLHVADHCRAVHLVLTRGAAGEIYNVGGGTERTNTAITEEILALLGHDWSKVRRVADRKGHDLRYSLDGTKLETVLGFVPQVDFTRGLAETVAWYRDNPEWWKSLKHQQETAKTSPGDWP